MEERNLTCICCPLGCSITVKMEDGKVCSVTGNTCPRGDAYARKEVTNPTRIVTTTVRVLNGENPTVSCKTASDIPKDKIFAIVAELKGLEVKAPIEIGDVILPDVANTGVSIIATSNVNQVNI